ncbi:hypothetical protein E4198_00120 [Streptomyces sp. RKND-216]|uniref:hypothetical protein n=1 Tax=Streptomyces sp. RKND-216 TaxID=2562581 RepID=UPI00109DFA37|nr:hypothetical protein [Streptomyces sp. RKND-216]THA28255.1 hypothetical protein E4198_00120 [Streptomyces sp. RKND-216]
MPEHGNATNTPQRAAQFQDGDLLLYRDPEAYLTGAEDHTVVCRVDVHSPTDVEEAHYGRSVPVRVISSGERLHAPPAFVRRIDPAEVMRTIDTAPLHGDVSALESAASAWLRQQPNGRD